MANKILRTQNIERLRINNKYTTRVCKGYHKTHLRHHLYTTHSRTRLADTHMCNSFYILCGARANVLIKIVSAFIFGYYCFLFKMSSIQTCM